jgi:hypothetical protein
MIKSDVKIIKADLPEHEFIYLVPLSDFHWDEPQSDHKAIKGYVDWIKNHKNAYTLLNGDLWTVVSSRSVANYFETSDKGRYELIPIDDAFDQVEDLLKPIADRILAADTGGHEFNHAMRETGMDLTYRLMKNLGIRDRYARDGGVLLIKTKPLTPKDRTFFSAVFTHGWGGARTRGAKLRKAEYLAEAFEADMIVISHDHTQNVTRKNILTIPNWSSNGVQVHRTMLISTGAFRGYTGYPFRSGYQPSDLGTPRIRIGKRLNDDGTVRKDIHASI